MISSFQFTNYHRFWWITWRFIIKSYPFPLKIQYFFETIQTWAWPFDSIINVAFIIDDEHRVRYSNTLGIYENFPDESSFNRDHKTRTLLKVSRPTSSTSIQLDFAIPSSRFTPIHFRLTRRKWTLVTLWSSFVLNHYHYLYHYWIMMQLLMKCCCPMIDLHYGRKPIGYRSLISFSTNNYKRYRRKYK